MTRIDPAGTSGRALQVIPRLCLVILGALAALGCSSGDSDAAAAGSRPHILIILADDLGWGDLGIHGSVIHTPNIDQLAAEGLELQRFYAFPLCTASRYALMTGRSPVRAGLLYTPLKAWDDGGIPEEDETVAELLSRARYETAMVGKWHLGHRRRSDWPTSRGFQHFYGCLTGIIDYDTHIHAGGGLDWQRDGESVHEQGYATDLLAAEAVRRIEAHDPERPLFLYLAFTAPHMPLQAPEAEVERYLQTGLDRKPVTYAAMVDRMDQAVGRVLRALDEAGMARDTLVLFLSDNGASIGEAGDNGPFRGGKGSTLEGGIRVPAILRWPGRLPAGAVSEQVITIQDILPLFAEAAGVQPQGQPLDGRSTLASLVARQLVPREELFFSGSTGRKLRFALLRGEWKLFREESRSFGQPVQELYRIPADPREEHDLSLEHPELVQELAGRLQAWHALQPEEPASGTAVPKDWRTPEDWAAAARD